jgi:2,3-bisphosphoglycerate-dependent phosphoglycerate mutase
MSESDHSLRFITFLRHGRSRADDEGVHEGRYDSPLTEVGRFQAHTRAQQWLDENIDFDGIISSPLIRTKETAEIIAASQNLKVILDPDWMEFDSGLLAGLPFAVALEKYPPPAVRDPHQSYWQCETMWDFNLRAIRAIQNTLQHEWQRTLVVSHGAILNRSLSGLCGSPLPDQFWSNLKFAFGDLSFAHLSYHPAENRWTLLEFRSGYEPLA